MNTTLQWWHIGGLLMGIVQAAYLLLNQHFRIEPRLLMIWRGFGTALLLAPLALYLSPPAVPLFYVLSILTGLCIGVFDRLLFQASAQYGAGQVSRLLALSIPLAFVFWLALHPAHLQTLLARPYIALAPLAMLGLLGSALALRHDAVSWQVTRALLPVYLLGAMIDVLNKTATQQASGLAAFVTYGTITALVSGLLNLLWPNRQAPALHWKQLVAPQVRIGGFLAVLTVSTYLLIKTASLSQAPNPAFISALNLTAPVWVLLWNRLQRVQDSGDLRAGLACVISAVLLILSTL